MVIDAKTKFTFLQMVARFLPDPGTMMGWQSLHN